MFCSFWKLPFEVGDRVWILCKGELAEAEIQTATINGRESDKPVVYHTKVITKGFGNALIDFTLDDINLMVWKDKDTALKTINSVKFEEKRND